jgi:hypothetical protein
MTEAASPRSEALELALASQDAAAVAFALRHDVVVVPKLVVPTAEVGASRAVDDDSSEPTSVAAEQVRVFGRENTDKRILLLFSSAEAYAAMVPDDPDLEVMLYDSDALRAFMEVHLDVLEQVFFDIAGPHTMAAAPEDLLKALK